MCREQNFPTLMAKVVALTPPLVCMPITIRSLPAVHPSPHFTQFWLNCQK